MPGLAVLHKAPRERWLMGAIADGTFCNAKTQLSRVMLGFMVDAGIYMAQMGVIEEMRRDRRAKTVRCMCRGDVFSE